jgi:Zn-dependent protease with chaperone function
MNRVSYWLFLSFLFVAATSIFGQAQMRDRATESAFVEELRAIAPGAVDSFVNGTTALDAGNNSEAEKYFADVLAKAPDYEPALRRRGYALVALGRRSEGKELTQKALDRSRSVDNLVGQASILINSNDADYQPTRSESLEAYRLAKEAWDLSKEADLESGLLLAQSLILMERVDEFVKFAPELKAKFPGDPVPGYFNVLALVSTGDYDGAEAEVGRIKALGFPAETADSLLIAIDAARDESFFGIGRYFKYGYVAAMLIAVWTAGLIGLFLVGRNLSARTLRSIEESDPNDIGGREQASLKNLYRRIISAAGIYYYISQPFVIFIVIATTVSVFLFFIWLGRIPIKLVLVLGAVALFTIFYMIKSLVWRPRVDDPGRPLTEHEAPGLWRLVKGVAETMKTRPVTEIRITHGADLAVYERGSFRAKMSDKADRILILGTAVLNGFDQNAFRAVLAHEYGHFSNRDTAGGDIAFRVNTDIIGAANSMAASGTATVYNIGFQFLRLFHFLFRRITHGASRLQEVLADRVAAYHYGVQAFKDGLNHVIMRELEFEHLADREINAAMGANRAVQNLYEMTIDDDGAKRELSEQFKAVIERPTSDDDTHPSSTDRYRYIEQIRSSEVEPLSGEVWELFADRAAITAEMSDLIEKLVRPGVQPSNGGILGLG